MSINRSGQFRKKKIHFTQVSNMALRDPALSLKAKGLYSLINS
ncbi:RNA replicase, partial [Clostridium perfringens]|nr:RNA replicase [Clostridium perfringens]